MQKIKIDSIEKIFSRKQMLSFGLLSILVSFGFLAGSGLMIKSAIDFVNAEDNSGSAISSRACMTSLRQMGSSLKVNQVEDNHIKVSSAGLKNASLKLSQASVASVVCPGWELSQFCMGESCTEGEGLYFDLKIIDKLNLSSKEETAASKATPTTTPTVPSTAPRAPVRRATRRSASPPRR